MPNNILLLGAGFSRNWGGRLASEVRSDLLVRVQADTYLSQLLQKNDFETALSMVQADFASRLDGETETRLRLILLRHELSPSVDGCVDAATWTTRQDFDERADQMHAHGCN